VTTSGVVRLSAVIITRNEAANLAGCLASLRGLVDEIVLDGTPGVLFAPCPPTVRG